MTSIKNSEVNRRDRTSVAIIGLAISMGASNVLLPRQGDEAKAAEPVGAEPTTTTVNEASDNATVVSPATITGETPVPQKKLFNAAALSTPSLVKPSLLTSSTPTLPVMESQAKLGQTQWHVSNTYHIDALDTAANKPTDILPPTKVQNVTTFPSAAKASVLPQATPMASPLVIPPKAANLPGSAVSPVPSLATPETSPVVTAPSEVMVPHLVTKPDSKQTVAETPKVQTPAVAQPQVAAGDVYQVKPEDTLEAIAKAHGVSRDELVVVIPSKVAKSPSPAAATSPVAVPPKAVTLTNPVDASYKPPAWEAIPKLPNPVVEPQVPEAGGVYQVKSGESVDANAQASGVSRSQLMQANQIEIANRKRYAERLRDKVIQMQEKYWVQREGQPKPIENLAIKGVTPTVPIAWNNRSRSSQYINPEFNPNSYNQALQRENHALLPSPSVEQAPIPIKVPAPDAPTRQLYSPLVAVPPKGSDTYNPTIQPPVGQTVAPEFPPPGAYPYEPIAPGNFNGYIWPSKGVLTSGFGMRWGRMHKGIDIAAPIGTPVMAAATGVVVYAHWNTGGYGNLVDIQHPDGSITRYGHNNRILVREGQQIQQGQQIAEMGSTGHSTGSHCHFEVHPRGEEAVNPIAFLPRQ